MAKSMYQVYVEFEMEVEADSQEEAEAIAEDYAPINCSDNYVTKCKKLYDLDEEEINQNDDRIYVDRVV